jgi:hypothetical protein
MTLSNICQCWTACKLANYSVLHWGISHCAKVYTPERTSAKNNQNNSATTFSVEEDDSSDKDYLEEVPTRSKYLKLYRKETKMEVEGNDERHQRAGLGSDMQQPRR